MQSKDMVLNVKITACIVTYNNSKDIIKAADSLLNAAKSLDFTLYISDNNSEDDTVAVAQAHYKSNSRVVILKNTANNGFGAGHNAPIKLLDSKYHFIVNPDITVEGDNLIKIVDFLEKNSDVGMLCPMILNGDGTEQVLPKRIPKYKYLLARRLSFMKKAEAQYTMRGENLQEVTDIQFCTGCFMAIRTELFKKAGGFDPRYFMYFEDADLTREINRVSRVVMYRSAFVTHRWERASGKQLKYLFIQIKSMGKYFKKWKNKI